MKIRNEILAKLRMQLEGVSATAVTYGAARLHEGLPDEGSGSRRRARQAISLPKEAA